MTQASEVLEVVASCEDADEAVTKLQKLLGVDEIGPRAVMDVQFRRVTGRQLRDIRDRVIELEAERDRLRACPGPAPST